MKDHSQRSAVGPTGNTHDHDWYWLSVLNQRIEAPSPRREHLDWTRSVPFDSIPISIIIQNNFKTYGHDGSLSPPAVTGRVAQLTTDQDRSRTGTSKVGTFRKWELIWRLARHK